MPTQASGKPVLLFHVVFRALVNGSGMQGWIGVDLDGTLAEYDDRRGLEHIGRPVPAMLARVREWLAQGIEVRIFTARASDPALTAFVTPWLREHNLPRLDVVGTKDLQLLQIWDDRALQVEANTGRIITPRQHIHLVPQGWIGVELDGVLAKASSPQDMSVIGEPVDAMMNRIRQWVMVDVDVRILTARASVSGQEALIQQWLASHGIKPLPVTNQKDFRMTQFFDCEAVHVIFNEGEPSSVEVPALPQGFRYQ